MCSSVGGDALKKRTLEGTLNSHNSFAALDNELIVNMASKMGVDIPELHFDSIDIMKDLEIARHALDRIKIKDIPTPVIEEIEVAHDKGIPLLEWLHEDSESENFTIVQSRKKTKTWCWKIQQSLTL
jgi:hypothetical protein